MPGKSRLWLIVTDGELRFSKVRSKNGAKKYFALDIGNDIPSKKMFDLLVEHIKKQAKLL